MLLHLLKLLFVSCFFFPGFNAFANPTVADITDLVLVTGQSNVRASETEYDSSIDSVDLRVFAYTGNDDWEVADLHQVWDVDGWHPGNDSIADATRQPYNNFAFHFAKTVVERDPQRVVGIIIASAPGKGILHWEPGGGFYQEIGSKVLDALNAQGVKSGLDGILWHQGETDWQFYGTSDQSASEEQRSYSEYYPDKLNGLITAFRNESWFDNGKPFICGETKQAKVNGRLMALNSDGDAWTGCVQASDLCTKERETEACNDVPVLGTHFDASGLRLLGERYGNKYLDIIEANRFTDPELTSPQPGGTLSGSVEVFEWTAHSSNISQWWLTVGRSASQSSNYFSSGSLAAGTSSIEVSDLPTDGSEVYAKLWYRVNGDNIWYYIDQTYTASGSSPSIEGPVPGTQLNGATETFNWQSNGANVSEFWLDIGSSVGASDYYKSGSLNTATSTVASGLPSDGVSAVYVRLWYRFASAGAWHYVDETYTAGTAIATGPVIVSPASGSTLSATASAITWIENNSGAVVYWVYAGSSQGGRQYYDSGELGNQLTTTINGLPADGSAVWVRIWYRGASGGSWQFIDAQYTAVDFFPSISTSGGSDVLANPDDTFSWTDPTNSVTQWWLYVGSSVGGNDYEDSGNLGPSTAYTTANGNLPTGAVPVYVRLWFRQEGGSWEYTDEIFTSAP